MIGVKDYWDVFNTLSPATRNINTAGNSIDLANAIENYVLFHVGAITDGTHTPKLQESSDGISFTDVAPSDQIGTLTNFSANSVQTVSYIGSKRYIRAYVSSSGVTGATYGATVHLKLRKKP